MRRRRRRLAEQPVPDDNDGELYFNTGDQRESDSWESSNLDNRGAKGGSV